MTPEESMAEANRILAEAGWTPIPKPCWNGGFTMARQVGGRTPDGLSEHVKGLDIVKPGDPDYGPETPDEHHEAAAWLVARFPANPLTTEATLGPVAVSHGTEAEQPLHIPERPVTDITRDAPPEPAYAPEHEDGTEAPEADALLAGSPVLPDAPDGEGEAVFDADFGEIEPADDALDLGEVEDYRGDPLLLEGEAGEAPVTDEPSAPTGQDRFYGLSDLDRRKNVKLLRLATEAMRRRMEALGEWNETELLHQQTQLNRFIRGELGAGPQAQAHFDAVGERVAAVARIDSARAAKEFAIAMATDETIDAFDPEADWP